MTTPDHKIHWRKSSYSSESFNCVEVADVPGAVLVRDSKDPGGPVLEFAPAAWREFVAGLREAGRG